MAETGRDDLEWSVPEDVPKGRCGFTTGYDDKLWFPGNVTCWRETRDGQDHCIWHADVRDKPAGDLANARMDIWERLDGAVLRETDLAGSISFDDCVLRGVDLSGADIEGTDFRNADLWKADFTDACLWNCNLTGAELIDAGLSDTDLRGADLSNADLRQANIPDGQNPDLRGVTATGICIDYTNLDDIVINEGTTFGGPSLWETRSDVAAKLNSLLPLQPSFLRCVGRPSTDPHFLKRAELQYRATQRILRENDLRQLPELAVREKHARRKRALAERDYWTWLKLAFYRWPLGYGERVSNVLATSAVTIVGFALAYPFVGGMEASTGETTSYAFGNVTPAVAVPEWVDILGANLYFSAVTFSTLGYGDIQPASPAAQALASIESLLGALLMAFLVFVLGRRTTW